MTESIKSRVTATLIKPVFPFTPLKNIEGTLPTLLQALEDKGLCDREIVIYAIATVAVENPQFIPVSERPSKYSDKDGMAPYDFSKYDTMTGLGNTPQLDGDGEKFRGRGLIQITGKSNYADMSKKLGLDDGLLTYPDYANEIHIASAIFAQFFKDREERIRKALVSKDHKALRKIVNGGLVGFDIFEKAYNQLEKIIV